MCNQFWSLTELLRLGCFSVAGRTTSCHSYIDFSDRLPVTSKLLWLGYIDKIGLAIKKKEIIHGSKVNRGDWLGSPASIKETNKDAKIYVGRSTTLHNLLFCAHTLCMDYVTNTFLLVSSSVRSKQLLYFVQGQGLKREQ